MKNLVVLFVLSLIGCSEFKAQDQSPSLEKVIFEIYEGFVKKDDSAVNVHLNPDDDAFIMYRIGVHDFWGKIEKLCISAACLQEDPDHSIGNSQDRLENLNFSTKPPALEYTNKDYFDCETVEKEGIFIAEKGKYHVLSEAMKMILKYETSEESDIKKLEKDIQKAEKLESQSHRVIINSNGYTLVFYLTPQNKTWYISIVDFASTDCSA